MNPANFCSRDAALLDAQRAVDREREQALDRAVEERAAAGRNLPPGDTNPGDARASAREGARSAGVTAAPPAPRRPGGRP